MLYLFKGSAVGILNSLARCTVILNETETNWCHTLHLCLHRHPSYLLNALKLPWLRKPDRRYRRNMEIVEKISGVFLGPKNIFPSSVPKDGLWVWKWSNKPHRRYYGFCSFWKCSWTLGCWPWDSNPSPSSLRRSIPRDVGRWDLKW